jgi:hypothetical protein
VRQRCRCPLPLLMAGAGAELRELRSDDFEAELPRYRYRCLQVVLLLGSLGRVCGRHTALLEHALESRGRDDDQRTGAVGLHLEGVRHPARPPDPGAGTGDELIVPLAEADLTVEDIQGLVLAAVDVEWRPEAL